MNTNSSFGIAIDPCRIYTRRELALLFEVSEETVAGWTHNPKPGMPSLPAFCSGGPMARRGGTELIYIHGKLLLTFFEAGSYGAQISTSTDG